ncbi:hypothetical protein T261_1040 [Streptomyces lydicus]|nr:hypothetical protein T261_1040 [Streptomyces lydicus]
MAVHPRLGVPSDVLSGVPSAAESSGDVAYESGHFHSRSADPHRR